MKHLIGALLIAGLLSCKKDHSGPPDDNRLSLDSLAALNTDMPFGIYNDLIFTNSSTGYALSGAFIARTTNGGLHWDSIPLPMSNSWRKIRFADASNGYIIGGDNTAGFLLKTTDAGQSWSVIDLHTIESPTGLYFLSKDIGYITGTHFFRKTIDGGQTWTLVRQGEQSIFNDVAFSDPLHGIVTALNGVYYKTSNGGLTWDSLRYAGARSLGEIHFAGNSIFTEKWLDSVVDINNNSIVMSTPSEAYRLLFIDDRHCIAVGSHYVGEWSTRGDLFISNNGWQSFSQKTYDDVFHFRAIARMSANKAMIIGPGGPRMKVLVLNW